VWIHGGNWAVSAASASGFDGSELARLGVRRISTGSLLAGAAYGALAAGARELQSDGTSRYAAGRLSEDDKQAAFG